MNIKLDKLEISKLERMKEKMKLKDIQVSAKMAIMFGVGLLMQLDGTNKICIKSADGKVQEVQFNFHGV
jgi:hypothetical protein